MKYFSLNHCKLFLNLDYYDFMTTEENVAAALNFENTNTLELLFGGIVFAM